MAAMEQPFGEIEVRYFLAEILKTSSIAPLDLMNFIQERGIQPSWYEMSLPYGAQGKDREELARAEYMTHRALGFLMHRGLATPPSKLSTKSASKPKKKRPASGENVSSADRMIQPQQPSNFPPVNAPGDSATGQVAAALVPGGPPKKKRGRPSKAEHEAKVAEAAARGEEYKPTPRRKKPPRPPQGTQIAGMVTPSMTDVGAGGEFSTGNNKARKPNAAPEEANSLAFGTTSRNFALEATAHAADKMQVEEDKPVQNTIPGTQASEFEARESLLANMREHADQFAPNTIQSTMTLQHDSTPQHNFISYQGPSRDPATTGEQHFL